MIPNDVLSVRSLKTILIMLAGFVTWRVSLDELRKA